MPGEALIQDRLHDELEDVSRKLRAAEVARGAARILSDREISRSDAAWLASIFVGDVGTAMAVVKGQRAGQWAAQAQQLDERVQALRIRQQLLELMISLRG